MEYRLNFRYFSSYDANVDVSCEVTRLELPPSSPNLHNLDKQVAGGGEGGGGGEEDPFARVVKGGEEEEIYVTVHVACNGEVLHTAPLSTYAPSKYDANRHCVVWVGGGDLLTLPVKYRDLSRDAQLLFTVWGSIHDDDHDHDDERGGGRRRQRQQQQQPLGTTAMDLFDGLGVLRTGKQKLRLQVGGRGRSRRRPRPNTTTTTTITQGGAASSSLGCGEEEEDLIFQLEKARERYDFNQVPPVDWLDRLSLPHMSRVLEQLTAATSSQASSHHSNGGGGTASHHYYYHRQHHHHSNNRRGEGGGMEEEEEEEEEGKAFLIVTLPIFHLPVLYEEKAYPGVGLPGSSSSSSTPTTTTTTGGSKPNPSSSSSSNRLVALEGGGSSSASDDHNQLCVIYDCEAEAGADVNPVEAKYRKLAHDKFRGIRDPSLKPNKEERERIEAIVASPSDHLKVEDRDLLWTFQFSLTENKKALTKFLLSVDWSVEQEVEQVPALLEQWRHKTTIDFSDALKLLGREKAFQNEVVRSFGVEVLRRATDEEIQTYLLQLVQALRYEKSSSTSGGGEAAGPGEMMEGGGPGGGGVQSSILARFLIDRAVGSLELSNFLAWYLRVELDDATSGDMFKAVYDEFFRRLDCQNPGLYKMLQRQETFINKIATAQRMAREEKGRRDSKEEKLRRLLGDKDLTSPPPVLLTNSTTTTTTGSSSSKAGAGGGGDGGDYIPVPLDPSIQVTGVVPQTAFMFKSAMYPAVIEFKVYEGASSSNNNNNGNSSTAQHHHLLGGGLGQGLEAVASSASRKLERLLGTTDHKEKASSGPAPHASTTSSGDGASSGGGSYKVIFKNGDDLRQDQLIIQMITLMDQLLKRVNLDLKLKPYRILATGPRDGLMEFVDKSLPVSEVLSKYNASILDFLRHHNPDPSAPLGVSPDVMATFLKSCAGYCVITYILGIGDRHLDNIMMLPSGNLFHIDFGFIFGNDPKPLPPPFRFTREMADAMGGEGHENYTRFKRYCCQAYNCFRENANLILNLLGLMVDAGIKDLSSDHQTVLNKIEEKFRLDLTVEQAEHYFVSLISESLNALAPIIFENFHRIAVARR